MVEELEQFQQNVPINKRMLASVIHNAKQDIQVLVLFAGKTVLQASEMMEPSVLNPVHMEEEPDMLFGIMTSAIDRILKDVNKMV